jgi:hypothetical protein
MKFATIFLALVAGGAMACAAPVSFAQCPNVGNDTTGCELLITVTAVNGSGMATAFTVATSSPDHGPFDGNDDTLIGITNGTSSAVKSIYLFGGVGGDIFGFDGDGACPAGSYTPGPTAAECGTSAQNPTGYGSETNVSGTVLPVTFTVGGLCGASSTDCGTVSINGSTGLANGQSTWFDLEGRVTGTSLMTPEPGSMMLLGSGLAGLAFFARKRRAAR